MNTADATPWGVAALQIVGAKTGAYTMLATEDPEVFEQNSLALNHSIHHKRHLPHFGLARFHPIDWFA